GTPVTAKFEEELPAFNQLIAGIPIGQTIEAVLWREGAEKTVSIKTSEREEALPQQHELKQWGITVRDISYVMSKEMKRENRDGVAVTSVRPGGPAGEAKPDIQEGDVLVQVGDTKINNVEELRVLTETITKGATEPVPTLTTFDRKAGSLVTVVKVGIKELDDPGLEVKKAWLPVETQVITREVAEGIGKTDLTGFRVTQVYPGTTAETAGLKVGDLLVAVDGEALTASMPEHYEELPALIRNYRVGTVADISVVRAGETVKVPVELVRAPMLDREMKKYRDEDFGFTTRDVTFFDRANERWKQEQQGALVEEVESGSWTALGGLGVSDLIIEIFGRAVENVETAEAAMDAVMAEKPESVVFKVHRGIYTLYLEMEPRWDDN
ncbi:MAG: PDZ domain-containing protein, partial [Candidatus Hydrogenedentota bacterium]